LDEKLRGRGWQPSRAEMAALFEELKSADRDRADLIERALARRGGEAGEAAIERFAQARAPERGRLVKLIGRFPQLKAFLLGVLEDDDAKARRNAVIALGKLGGDDVEAALRNRWPRASLEERRSLADALGKIGGREAEKLLSEVASDDPELSRIVGEARLKLQRTLGRGGALDAEVIADSALNVLFHCRDGLAEILRDEIGRAKILDEETVSFVGQKSLGDLQKIRTALYFGFPLPTGGAREPGEALMNAITSPAATAILRAFTRGPLRYRIEWASGGHRRGLTFRTAQAIAKKNPALLNDPTDSLWEVIVDESRGIRVELWPRGLADERFAYRVEQVPASSHPTLAAALARLGEAKKNDVVWDPFVGGATELVERARLGPYAKLIGTDLDEGALGRARINLAAANLPAELQIADARSFDVKPDLIITNPPMGRRVLNKSLTGALYDEFLAHAAKILPRGGRLAWISPRAEDTARRAKSLGFEVKLRQRVDMAGFWAELQVMIRK
jgi:predicted RNA methylase